MSEAANNIFIMNRKGIVTPSRLFLFLVFLILTGFLATPSALAKVAPQDYEVKAALLRHIVRFVQWPENLPSENMESFRICILGDDSIKKGFEPFVGDMLHGCPISIETIQSVDVLPPDCRVLFIGLADRVEIARVLGKVAGRPILTVSDKPLFTDLGGTIGLLEIGEDIRFSVNTSTAGQSGLTISSSLLRLAVSIQGYFYVLESP